MLVKAGDVSRMVCPVMAPYPPSNVPSTCVGPKCMAWRWDAYAKERTVDCAGADEPERYTLVEPPRPQNVPASWDFVPGDPEEARPSRWVEPVAEVTAQRYGYCGLCSRPLVEG